MSQHLISQHLKNKRVGGFGVNDKEIKYYMDLEQARNEFIENSFFQKYKDKYYTYAILKYNFKEKGLQERKARNRSYIDVVNMDCEVLTDFIKLYYDKAKFCSKELAEDMIRGTYNSTSKKREGGIYQDPDGKSIIQHDNCNVDCSADAIFSIKRIIDYIGDINLQIIEEYHKLRKIPIFHFPKEPQGINESRAFLMKPINGFSGFADKIDYTLYDIKNYLEGKPCKMAFVYEKRLTNKWLRSFKRGFPDLIDWFEIKGIFTDEEYNVYNIEIGDGFKEVFKDNDYLESYKWDWSKQYYENVSRKIEIYNKRQQLQIILKLNHKLGKYNQVVRTIDDIKTFAEAMQNEDSFSYGDYSKEDAERDMKIGKITIYSSKDIVNGTFVLTSKRMATDYAGGNEKDIKSKEVWLDEVAWINGDKGIYANA